MDGSVQNQDIVLLVVSAAGNDGLTPVQLQKSVFLVGKSGLSGLPTEFYSFTPYNYGPFNANIYRDAEHLAAEGLLAQVQAVGRTWPMFSITPAGRNRAEKLYSRVQDILQEHIKNIVEWVKAQSFTHLLRTIYAKYPEFKENSVFQE